MKKNLMNFCSRVLMLSMLSMSLWMPSAQADMISSEQVIAGHAAQLEREHLRKVFDRQDVLAQLQARGVDAEAARARVDALTDDEIATINGKLDSLPAGGDIVGAVVFIFIVLLITDILGLTKVFPFTKSIHH
jgi:hypothetical protein